MTFSVSRMNRMISVILSFCLIFALVAPNVSAAPGKSARTPQKNEGIQPNIGELPRELPEEKVELKSKRTKYSKRFLNPDGTFTEEIYLEPQFYQDSELKQWKKVDNRLKASEKTETKFTNTANSFQAEFARQSNQKKAHFN
ncbi:hypothetical protein LC040_02850 [Bacillus tianshenii]|nr:hypothetical protein LC040_02850 [Bacillus tianshenii]